MQMVGIAAPAMQREASSEAVDRILDRYTTEMHAISLEQYAAAVAVVREGGHASISLVQQHLGCGFEQAARMIEQMEIDGIIGPADGATPRAVL